MLMKNNETVFFLTFLTALLFFPIITKGQEFGNWSPRGMGGGGAMFAPAISPNDPDLMFVSCDMGGFYRSADGGNTWQMINFLELNSSIAARPVFSQTDDNIVYAVTCSWAGTYIMFSNDAGVTWDTITPNPLWSEDSYLNVNIGIDPDKGNVLFFGAEENAYISQNSGISWVQCPGVSGRVVGFYTDRRSNINDRTYYIGTIETIYRSDNNGDSWYEVITELPTYRPIRSFAGSCDTLAGEQILYCAIPSDSTGGVYHGGVYRSSDGGSSWESAMGSGINKHIGLEDQWGDGSLPEYYVVQTVQDEPDLVYVSNTGTAFWPPHHGTIYKSTDGGDNWDYCLNWDPRNENYPVGDTCNLNCGWLPNEFTEGWGGHTDVYSFNPYFFSVCPTDADVAMVVNYGQLWITRDGGNLWQYGYTEYSSENPPYIDHANSYNDCMKGRNWNSNGLEVTSCWDVAFFDAERLFAGYADISCIRSTDGGNIFNMNMDFEGGTMNSTYRVLLDPDSSGVGYIAMSTTHDIYMSTHIGNISGNGKIMKTRDFGESWTILESFSQPVIDIEISPANHNVMYATIVQDGVYRSDSRGQSWDKVTDPSANTHVFDVEVTSDGTIFCSVSAYRSGSWSSEGGVFRSDDEGESWTNISHENMAYWTQHISLGPDSDSTLYVCVFSGWGGDPNNRGGSYRTYNAYSDTPSWTQIFATEEPCRIYNVWFHPDNPDLMYASTEWMGLYKSENASSASPTFELVEDFPFGFPTNFSYSPYAEELWVTTFGGGIWLGNTDTSYVIEEENTDIPIFRVKDRIIYGNPLEIELLLPEEGEIELNLYNTLGQKVADLMNENLGKGIHSFEFDTKKLQQGIYFLNVKTVKGNKADKIILLK
jgi:photosystem II stability/assembly factor-like uncharacterized protein